MSTQPTEGVPPATRPVLVVVGVGGMGRSIARRLGPGKTVLLADFNTDALSAAAADLGTDGLAVETQTVDVSQVESVRALARTAARLGPVTHVAHTAGLSPVQASVAAILAVDLVGSAHVLDAFEDVIAPGGAGVVIASMAGQLARRLSPEQENALAQEPTESLAALTFATAEAITDPTDAYSIAKRANQLRVAAASTAWGARGARINSISPGVIATPMSQQELAGPAGAGMRKMIAGSATGRQGTPEDITSAAAFLLGPEASFITGTDLLVDGGVVAGLRSGHLQLA